MSEWKFYDEDVPMVSTRGYHVDRERARHLEQVDHQPRLKLAARFIATLGRNDRTLSDLGCGDGGLLSLVQHLFAEAWGYDFAPANIDGCKERGVTAYERDVFSEYERDVFGEDQDPVRTGDVVVMTEVLEHLADPHGVLAWLRSRALWLVCSSPAEENEKIHSPEHVWAWDTPGYVEMITSAGWKIISLQRARQYQVVLAK